MRLGKSSKLGEFMGLAEKNDRDLKNQFYEIQNEWDIARNRYEFERASDLKLEMQAIVEELSRRATEKKTG